MHRSQDERVQAPGEAVPSLLTVRTAFCFSEHGPRYSGETASEETPCMELCQVPGACRVL